MHGYIGLSRVKSDGSWSLKIEDSNGEPNRETEESSTNMMEV